MAELLGIQSYCFREFKDNVEVSAKIKDLGLTAVEVCRLHSDFSQPDQARKALSVFEENGVSVVSTGVNMISPDEAESRKLFEAAGSAGCKVMSANFSIAKLDESIKLAEGLSREYGIRLAVHNHGGHHWLGNRESLDYLFSKTSPAVGLCLDTAWALDSREDPIEWVERYRERLYVLHLKDFTFKADRTPVDVVVGSGNLRLEDLRKALDAISFDGQLIIEYEGNPKDPVPSLKDCVETIKGVFKGMYR